MDECNKTISKWYDCYCPVNKKVLIKDDDDKIEEDVSIQVEQKKKL